MSDIDFVQQYQDARPTYEKLTQKLQSLLEQLLESQNIKATSVEGRTKAVESFRSKFTRPSKVYTDPLQQMTDLSGIRIILHSTSDVETVAKLIHNEFKVDLFNSMNKLDSLEPDKFGYLSQHFVVQIGDSRRNLPEWASLSDLRAEIQIRTALQHAWASVEHFLVYKNTQDVPKALRRRLYRLSALFELADDELNNIIHNINDQINEYKSELSVGNSKIEINIDSLRAYIQNAPEPKYWAQYLRESTGQRVDENDWGDLSRDVKFAIYFNIDSLESLDTIMRQAHGWGETFFERYFQDFFEQNKTTPDNVSTVINGPVTMLMIAANAEHITDEILSKDFGWGLGQRLINHALTARGHSKKTDEKTI